MKDQPPRRPFSFDLPDEKPQADKEKLRPFEFDVDQTMDYNELRTTHEASIPQHLEESGFPTRKSGLSLISWLMIFGIASMIMLGGADLYFYLLAQFQRSIALGAVLSMTIGCLLLVLLILIGREVRDYRALRRVNLFRQDVQTAMAAENQVHALNLVGKISQLYRTQPAHPSNSELQRRITAFEAAHGDHHTGTEIISRFARDVLKPMDERAYAIINR
jgi:uncharacterized membrane protein YcjF (UPF0283 family)